MLIIVVDELIQSETRQFSVFSSSPHPRILESGWTATRGSRRSSTFGATTYDIWKSWDIINVLLYQLQQPLLFGWGESVVDDLRGFIKSAKCNQDVALHEVFLPRSFVNFVLSSPDHPAQFRPRGCERMPPHASVVACPFACTRGISSPWNLSEQLVRTWSTSSVERAPSADGSD